MTYLRSLLAAILLSGCVGGTNVFEVRDAGPIECERPPGALTHSDTVTVETSPVPGDGLTGLCVRPLQVLPDVGVDCVLLEWLPGTGSATECEALPGRTHLRTELDESGALRQVCEIAQLEEGESVGWRYERAADLGSESDVAVICGMNGQRIAFVGFGITNHALVYVECAVSEPELSNALGSGCHTETTGSCGGMRPPTGEPILLWCDMPDHRCTVRCTTDADCANAGFPDERCAERGVCVITSCSEP